MKEKWDEIKVLLKKNDRISFESLNHGASEEVLDELEKTISQDLPNSFKNFYKIHNGWSELVWPYAMALLSIQEIIEGWKSLNSVYMNDLEDEYEGDSQSKEVKKLKWNKKWIPFAKSSRGRDFYCLDFDPSEFGTKGQVIFFSTDLGDREFAAASFEKWIDDFLEKIKTSSLTAF